MSKPAETILHAFGLGHRFDRYEVEQLGFSRQAAQRAIRKLLDTGQIRVTTTGTRSVIYQTVRYEEVDLDAIFEEPTP